ncbi:hypothetical protein MWU49_08160 [Alcanivorax sp. S6407]|uniref:hypothetical protein n=1 Tax=Alcanivorax sp. S6407 TaxID=2926424 RepID=UPI001FF66D6E|nr:hypothetical protein [Alcanivorax sp. S6407]MCK0153672.1 hypothetical protein [Alcanivorax sp. S6407]
MSMKKMAKGLGAMTLTTLSLTLPGLSHAEGSAAAQANNPLADIKAFNVQNYYIGELTDTDEDANQMVLRYAQPFSLGDSDWLMRASLPINTFPTGMRGAHQTGVGDADIFAAYLMDTGNPAISFGVGPQLVAPTASDDALGNEQWQAGVANVYFNATSAKYQYGYLLIYRGGIGDTNGRSRVSLAAMQPFFFYQLEDGWYTGTAPLWNYDFQSDNYSVPVGARLGKVLKANKTVFNVFMEPQVSIADRGPGQPEWQLFFAVNMQFM